MYSWVVPGAKVICINDISDFFEKPGINYVYNNMQDYITKGKIYTIRDFYFHETHNAIHLLLKCIYRPKCNVTLKEGGFHIDRFRPLISKTIEEDIEMFMKIASEVKNFEDA